MRFKSTTSLILIFFFLAPRLVAQHQEFTDFNGPYLGQTPPGTQPEVFGPGVISVDENFEHSAAVFSPRGDEVFWTTNVGWYTENRRQGMLRLYYMTMIDGTWTAPRIAPFAEHTRVERPVFSPDGNSLYFERERDLARESDIDIFVVHRTDDGWSEPEPVSPLINQQAAPGSANVFVSYKRADGSWSDRIETPYYSGGFLSLSPDGEYLFTMNEAICWISTSFVEDLRPER
jgi:Tol biopolymer transport system component